MTTVPAPKELDPSASLASLYGAKLRKLRIRAGWTQRELGDKIPVHHSQIAKYELANETPPKYISDRLDEILGADGDLSDLWVHVDRFPPTDAFRKYKEYEARATAVHKYLAHTVPGLLQTESYAREVMRQALPWCTAAEVEEKVAARLARKSILESPVPPLYWVVLDESVIRRSVGGPSVMCEQLGHLLKVSEAPNVEVQVLPFAAGGHASMGESVTLLSFDSGPDMAYFEGVALTGLVRDPRAVAQHSHRYHRVHAAALPPNASSTFIQEAMEGFDACEPT
ncbi:helix-turn-helix domain-containing protein [Streptomyces syringium]|uniref:helix-turn-helix domain-containing protein n=1 Tax=Streptomyces syringium TaxID=76729 RepID=UPI0034328805